jgi:hypothetical protein
LRNRLARVGPVAFAALTVVYRYLTIGTLENDHFVHLARAHQVLAGAWPIRDFVDPGMPLQYLASAAVATLLGPTPLADVGLHIAMLAIASGVTFALARRATDALSVAALVTGLQIVAAPRLYNAPKLLVHVVVLALAWRYVDRPSARRAAIAGAWIALAFLVRHDHALYAGGSMVLLICVCRRADGAAATRTDLVALGLTTVVCLLPWAAYAQWAIGLDEYVRAAIGFSRAEAVRTVLQWPRIVASGAIRANVESAAFYLLAILPCATMLLAWRRRWLPITPMHVAFSCLLLLLLEAAFLRDAVGVRLPDVSGPAAVVLACFLGLVARVRIRRVVASVLVLVAVGGVMGALVSRFGSRVTPGAIWRQGERVTERLTTWPWGGVVPSQELVPMAEYVGRCTTPTDRVLAGWFVPEFAVLARRPFAGGQAAWVAGYASSEADQARIIAQLRTESVPLLFVDETFADEWPRVWAFLMARPYRRVREIEVGGEMRHVWVDTRRSVVRSDPQTGLPCFAPRSLGAN